MKLKTCIYIINLDKAVDRFNFVQDQLKDININQKRISAVEGIKVKPDKYVVKNKYVRDLLPAEIGCSLSHIKSLQEFLKSDNDFAIILEDDAIISCDFEKICLKSIEQHISLSKENKWDVLKLTNGKRRHIKITNIKDQYILAACVPVPVTTIAAIWTRHGAKNFLEKSLSPLPIIKRPIDCELQNYWEYNLKIYNILPTLVNGSNFESQIRYTRPKSMLFKKINYEISRFIPKYYYPIKDHGLFSVVKNIILKNNSLIK